MQRDELRAIARAALADFYRVPPVAPCAMNMQTLGRVG